MADTEAKWYILHTYSGYENKVANDIMKVVENRNLQNVIEEVYLPVEMTKQTKENGKEVEVEEKLFGDCFETHDQKEGMACFLSREKPKPKAVFTNN